MIHLGDEVRDIITGCQGVAIERLTRLFGVPEIAVQRRNLNGDEGPMEKIWFAEDQLEKAGKTGRPATIVGNQEAHETETGQG